MIKTALIIEFKKDKVLAVTDSYEYIILKRKEGMDVGQWIEFDYSEVINPKKRIVKLSILPGIAAVFILAFLYMEVFYERHNFIYLDVDINPSIELALDRRDMVVDVKPLNDDGKIVLNGLNVKEINVSEALTRIIDMSEDHGFIEQNKENLVLVSVSSDQSSDYIKVDKIINLLEETLIDINSPHINHQIIKVTSDQRKKAVENNMSMGRYHIYLEAKSIGLDMNAEDVKNRSISDIVNMIEAVKEKPEVTEKPVITPMPESTTKITLDVTPTPTARPTFTPESTQINGSTSKPTETVTPTPVVKTPIVNTPIPTPTPTPANIPIGKELYDFEDGSLHGFKSDPGVELYIDSTNSFSGNKALKIRTANEGDLFISTVEVKSDLYAGGTINFYVWVPAGANLTSVEPFYQDNNWMWYGNWKDYEELKVNDWNLITLPVYMDSALPIKKIGLKVVTDGYFNGDILMDSISWSTAP